MVVVGSAGARLFVGDGAGPDVADVCGAADVVVAGSDGAAAGEQAPRTRPTNPAREEASSRMSGHAA